MSPTITAALYIFLTILTAWLAWRVRIWHAVNGVEGLRRVLYGQPTRVQRPVLTFLVRSSLATLAALCAFRALMALQALA
jgi:hypothetical protein